MREVYLTTMLTRTRRAALVISAALLGICASVLCVLPAIAASPATARYLDNSDGRDWPGYGRTFGEQHYSPLAQINRKNITHLGLVWSLDLGPEYALTQPIAVAGCATWTEISRRCSSSYRATSRSSAMCARSIPVCAARGSCRPALPHVPSSADCRGRP